MTHKYTFHLREKLLIPKRFVDDAGKINALPEHFSVDNSLYVDAVDQGRTTYGIKKKFDLFHEINFNNEEYFIVPKIGGLSWVFKQILLAYDGSYTIDIVDNRVSAKLPYTVSIQEEYQARPYQSEMINRWKAISFVQNWFMALDEVDRTPELQQRILLFKEKHPHLSWIFDHNSSDGGFLVAPAGAGKTFIGANIVSETQGRTLFILPTQTLFVQFKEELSNFLGIDEDEIGELQGESVKEVLTLGKAGIEKNIKPISVAMIQSLYLYKKELGIKLTDIFNHFENVVLDESHQAATESYTAVIGDMVSRRVIGLTATPMRRDGMMKLLDFYIGPTIARTPDNVLYDFGFLMKPTIVFRPYLAITAWKTKKGQSGEFLRDSYGNRIPEKTPTFPQLQSSVTTDPKRIAMVVSDIIAEVRNGNPCIVLSNRKEHLKEMMELYEQKSGLKAEILIGDITSKIKRKEVLTRFKQTQEQMLCGEKVSGPMVLFATDKLLGTGFNFPLFSRLFLTHPISAKIDRDNPDRDATAKLIQYIGRVARTFSKDMKATPQGVVVEPGQHLQLVKENSVVYDYVDFESSPEGTDAVRSGMLLWQFKGRFWNVYRNKYNLLVNDYSWLDTARLSSSTAIKHSAGLLTQAWKDYIVSDKARSYAIKIS